MNYLGRNALMGSDIYLKIDLLLPNSTIMRLELDHKDKSVTHGLLGCFEREQKRSKKLIYFKISLAPRWCDEIIFVLIKDQLVFPLTRLFPTIIKGRSSQMAG